MKFQLIIAAVVVVLANYASAAPNREPPLCPGCPPINRNCCM